MKKYFLTMAVMAIFIIGFAASDEDSSSSTDSEVKTVEEPKNPDECNVYNLCKLFLTPEEDETLRARYLKGGLSFKEAKDYLFEKIMGTLTPIQKKYAEISDEEIIKILKKWKESVAPIAEKKVEDVYKKVGFIL